MECLLENIAVHYEVFGEGKPIIILPGWGLNTRLTAYETEPYFKQREGWKRIYIDPPLYDMAVVHSRKWLDYQ